MSLLGEAGVTGLAALNHARASQAAERLNAMDGVDVLTPAFFNEFAVRLPKPAAAVVEAAAAKDVLAGVPASRLWPGVDGLENVLLIAVTETNTDEDLDALISVLGEIA